MEPSLACVLSYGLACGTPAQSPDPETAATTEAPASPSADEPSEAVVVLARAQAFFDGMSDMSASFRQTHVHPVYGTKDTSRGKLKVKKPGMMHWDYADVADHDVYADGKSLWLIERDTRQVVRRSIDDSDFASAVQFLLEGRKLVEEFFVRAAKDSVVRRYGKPGHDVIELKPKKKNPHYKRLTLVVARDTGRVGAFVVRNGDDSTNHFVLTNIKTNTGLRTRDFRFRVPKGYVMIED
jgi:outer membrane lipoprotein carrier protein